MSTATVPDLWPKFRVQSEPSPLAILRQQGLLLGERTRNAVYGQVDSKQEAPGKFIHTLFISAPYLEVKQQVIFVRHNLEPYPATVVLMNEQYANIDTKTVSNSQEMMTALRDMFQNEHLVKLIESLIVQMNALDDE